MFFYHGQCHNEHALLFGLEDRVCTPVVPQVSVLQGSLLWASCGINAAHVACREQDNGGCHSCHRPVQQGLYSWLSLCLVQ